MDANAYIAITAIVLSVVATVVTLWQAARSGSLGRTPVLVIRYDGKDERWLVSNVGYGPALNIKVAQQPNDRDDHWYNPVLIPAIAAGESFTLEWLKDEGDFSLGARYSSFLDGSGRRAHFTRTRHDQCTVYSPRQAPPWIMPDYSPGEARRHWEDGLPWKAPDEMAIVPAPREGSS